MSISRRSALKGVLATGLAGGLSSTVFSIGRAQSTPIQIGVVLPLSGPQQIVGQPMLLGAEISRDEINAGGGIGGRQIEFVVRDDKGDPTSSLAAMRELSGNGVNLMTGAPMTACAMAVIALLPDLNVVHIGTGSGEDKLTHELFNRHFFTANENNLTRLRAHGHLMASKYPDVRSWTAMLPDVTTGHGGWERMSAGLRLGYKQLHDVDVEILDPVLARVGSTDFKTQVARLMSSPAQGMHNILFGADGITFFNQAKDFGLDQKMTAISDSALDLDLPKALKSRMPQNVWTASYWHPSAFPDNAASQHLAKEFVSRSGQPYTHGFAALTNTAIKAYAAALQKTNGDTATDAIIDAMESVKLETVRGAAHFRKEDHQIVNTCCFFNAVGTDTAEGFKIADVSTLDLSELINPPTPGEPFKMQ